MKAGLLLFFLAFNVLAHDHHHVASTNTNTTINKTSGTALGIATANHHFDMGTYDWQGSAATGHFQDSKAFSFSIGKRYKDILINGSIGTEDGKTGYGAGITWRFK